jgi:GAF domain-containing protein
MQYQREQHPPGTAINPSDDDGAATSGQTVGLADLRGGYRDVVEDRDRLRALYRLDVLDTAPDDVFASLVEIVRRSFGVRVARIHLLDDTRQWVYAGTDDSACTSIPVGQSACQYAIRQDRTLVIPDLTADPTICRAVIGGDTMRFYAGTPLTTRNGHAIGVLCLLDPQARATMDPDEVELLESMAELIVQTMELRESQVGARDDLLRALDDRIP